MANSIACPSCHQPFGLPASFAGGRATCPNPKCGKTFFAPGPAGESAPGPEAGDGVAAPAVTALSRSSRTRLARPGATSCIPPNIYASPAFFAGGAVVALLYGMVLFAILNGQRGMVVEEVIYVDPTPPVIVARNDAKAPATKTDNKPAPAPDVKKAESSKPAPEAAKKESPKGEPKKGDRKKGDRKKGKKQAPPPTEVAGDPAAPTPNSSAEPNSNSGEPAQKKGGQKKASKEVALNTEGGKPPEPQGSPVLEGPTFDGLAPWFDPGRKSKSRREDSAIVLTVPPGIHILSPELKHKDAPRSLTEVTGDFTLKVQIQGKISPGSKALKDMPFAFQGAGLLLWQDEDNYLRFERAATCSEKQSIFSHVLIEVCREGRPGTPVYKPVKTPDRPVHLRITRKGDVLECAYSPDEGKNWVIVKQSSIAQFGDKLQVGIAASNVSPSAFSPRFEGFSLERGTPKTKGR